MTDDRWTAFLDRMHAAGWWWDKTSKVFYFGSSPAYDPETGMFYELEDKRQLIVTYRRVGTQSIPWTEYADAGTSPAPF